MSASWPRAPDSVRPSRGSVGLHGSAAARRNRRGRGYRYLPLPPTASFDSRVRKP